MRHDENNGRLQGLDRTRLIYLIIYTGVKLAIAYFMPDRSETPVSVGDYSRMRPFAFDII